MTEIEKIQEEFKNNAITLKVKVDEQIKSLIEQLKGLRLDACHIHFDGSGDSGSISDIYSVPENIKYGQEIYTELENWAEDLLETTGVDWYNNEGGQGQINIDVIHSKYYFEVYYNVVTTELGASDEVNV